jgi:D-3-phosphoglycerate dehydrogenase
MARRLHETVPRTQSGFWDKSALESYEVRGKRLGVLGLGNIGRQVARTAELLGMQVSFYDTRIVAVEVGQEMGWHQAPSMEALFAGSDAVTVHVSATDIHGRSNEALISRDALMALGAERPDTSPRLFLNLSRGFLHSAEDLVAAIQAGRVRRAAVDVYPDEPGDNGPGWANPYAGMEKIYTTPHIGAATLEAQPRIATRVAHTVDLFSRYGSVRDCVFAPRSVISMAEDAPGKTILVVMHSTTRGTKKALDEAIYEAGAANLRSEHRDFESWGLAVDANLLDKPLTEAELQRLVERTSEVTGDPTAVRLVRQMTIPTE